MASFSSTYPTQRPIFSLDASNAGRLDPRMTFSRADTPPTYAAPSAVHYWSNEKHLSSENLLLQSSAFNVTWTGGAIAERNSGQTDPAGGTDGFEIVEASTNDYHRLSQTGTSLGGSNYAFTVYAKQNTGTRYIVLTLLGNANEYVGAVFDLAGGTPTTTAGVGASAWVKSATQTASGNGYYKCTLKLTEALANCTATIHLSNTTSPTLDTYGRYGYTGDGSSIDVAFASLSTTGATDYNATTTSIHRQYAPSLKSVATAGQPRFEYDPSSDGQSMGILIEGQATNLNPYSDALASWGTNNALTLSANAGVGPDGSLGADLIVANTANDTHYIRSAVITVSAGSAYTFSGYFKSLNGEKLRLVFFQSAAPFTGEAGAVFTLTGSGSAAASAGSASITSVGNGYYRCTVTGTTLTTGSYLQVQTVSTSDSQVYVGNAYNGVLCAGIQFELGSFASSAISTSGSAATRAAESLSVATADIGYTGGPVSIVAESEGGRGDYPRLFSMGDSSSFLSFFRYSSAASASTAYKFWVYDSGTKQADLNEEASVTRVAVSVDTNSVKSCGNGGTVQSDTAAVMPVLSGLQIGDQPTGGKQWNGHIKRVALYNEALSDTNLQALTS
jgi:hypothetical protein